MAECKNSGFGDKMPPCTTRESENLISALLAEIDRVSLIRAEYEKINAGRMAAAFMGADIEKAKRALSDGDTVSMVAQTQILRQYEL